MNKNSRIRVKTPLGLTEAKETGPLVAQGSVDGAVLSSNNSGKGVNEEFNEPDKEIRYENLVLGPIIFMDDIFRMAGNLESAQYANDKMEDFVEKKILKLNCLKSG